MREDDEIWSSYFRILRELAKIDLFTNKTERTNDHLMFIRGARDSIEKLYIFSRPTEELFNHIERTHRILSVTITFEEIREEHKERLNKIIKLIESYMVAIKLI